MKYSIITYGCQMNESDSERAASALEDIGYKKASIIEGTDLIVVNMCSVRQSAVDRVYGNIKNFQKLKKKNKNLKTILTGCILKEDLKKFKDCFDYVLSIKALSFWPEILKKERYSYYPNTRDEKLNKKLDANYLKEESKYLSNFSAFVPIMTGCNNFCTFCVVPYVRGPEISKPAKDIIFEIENLIKQGFKEIWLLGQNVNSYKDKDVDFPKLLRMVNGIPGNFWIRFTSSHPKDFSDELIDTIANCKKVTEYLNLPVQSGDDKVLKRMNRPYAIKKYKEIIKKIRKKIPDIVLSTDVIVGFPGETKEQFENTAKLFKEIKYDMAYIAKYSPRPGTAAAKFKDDVPPQEKERRWKTLSKILQQTALEKNKNYIGKEIEVLVAKHETCNMKHFFIGKTKTYKTVKFRFSGYKPQGLVGQFVKVKIADSLPWGLKGEFLK